jgi:hypothetical protein
MNCAEPLVVTGVLFRLDGFESFVGVSAWGSAGSRSVSKESISMLKPQAGHFVCDSANSAKHRLQTGICIDLSN